MKNDGKTPVGSKKLSANNALFLKPLSILHTSFFILQHFPIDKFLTPV